MRKKEYIQLILFKNCQQEKCFVVEKNSLSFEDLIKTAEEWKNANPKSNTIRIKFKTYGCDNIDCKNCKQ